MGIVNGKCDQSLEKDSYTGREWDPVANLYFYRARWYDPGVGKFLSEDPLGFGAGDTNLSRYVFNNPGHAVDSEGKAATYVSRGWEFLRGMATGLKIPSLTTRFPSLIARKEYHQLNPGRDGFYAGNQQGKTVSPSKGAHALDLPMNQHHKQHVDHPTMPKGAGPVPKVRNSPYVSGSRLFFGAETIEGRLWYIDEAGLVGDLEGEVHSRNAILHDMYANDAFRNQHQGQINQWSGNQAKEMEVLMSRRTRTGPNHHGPAIPARYVWSRNATWAATGAHYALKGLGWAANALDVLRLGAAAAKSYQIDDIRPFAAETIRVGGGVAAGLAGAQLGLMVVATGPFGIVAALAGAAIVGGLAYTFGIDPIADLIWEDQGFLGVSL